MTNEKIAEKLLILEGRIDQQDLVIRELKDIIKEILDDSNDFDGIYIDGVSPEYKKHILESVKGVNSDE